MKAILAVSTTSFALSLFLLAAPSNSRAQNLFVANGGNNTIEEFNSSGVGTVFASSGLDVPEGMAFDSAGNLYVANEGGGTIVEFSSSGGVLRNVGTVIASGLNIPRGLAVDAAGNLYVASDGYSVLKITSGVGTLFASTRPTPIGLAFDSSGNLYVAIQGGDANGITDRIEEFNSSGGVLSSNGTVFAGASWEVNYPSYLAFDKSGNLYVGNPGNNTVGEFNPSGVGTVFASSGLNNPQGMAFDNSGNLYVANGGNNTIEEFNSSGVGKVFASSGVNQPFGLAIQVPEPSTWAMVAMGIGTLLGGLRLPRRSS